MAGDRVCTAGRVGLRDLARHDVHADQGGAFAVSDAVDVDGGWSGVTDTRGDRVVDLNVVGGGGSRVIPVRGGSRERRLRICVLPTHAVSEGY